MKVFTSNHLPELAEALRESLTPKAWVIVPSEEVKLDLYLRWLEKTEIVAGIRAITYNELIRKMFPEIPSKTELTLRITSFLEEHENELLKVRLADALSSLFLQYLQRPKEELQSWLKEDGWQQKIWGEVFGKTLPTDVVHRLKGEFFFYHISHITPYEWEAFTQMDTTWFVFSPSEMYLGDFVSTRKQQYLLGQHEELLHFFEQDSPLLSNWSEYGKSIQNFLEDADTIELFHSHQSKTALQLLKQEWLTLEKQQAPPDFSIQLHTAPTILREVEVVWEIIQSLPFTPREILVVAPDIALYAPSIEWVFKERGGPFNYSLTGLQARTSSPLLQGFEQLISLPQYRFSREAFSKLLLCEPFLKKFQLSREDTDKLLQWMSEMHLQYDLDGHSGSWHATLKRSIESMISSIHFSETPLMNRWIEITHLLETHLEPLSGTEKRTPIEWAEILQNLIDTFFFTEESSDMMRSFFNILRQSHVDGLFSFTTIEHLLKSALENRSGSMNKSTPDSVRFTSLKEGALTPCKTIICMGMQEGAFPRSIAPTSLQAMNLPSSAIVDKHLFLEAISHAEDRLILTYPTSHPEDGKEVHPSPLIQELSKDRGGITTFHHPASALDPAYYQENGFKSYSTLHYKLLKTSVKPVIQGSLPSPIQTVVDIRLLKKMARHPVQCFLEEGLMVKFPWKETHSEFLFSPLETHRLRKAALHLTTDELIQELDKKNKLPVGKFRDAALLSIEKEINRYRENIAQLQVDPSTIFTLELTPYAKTFTSISKDYVIAPPLDCNGILIQGTIENVTTHGLLFHGDELLTVWPLYLVVKAVLKEASLFLTKKGEAAAPVVADPLEALNRYLKYLKQGLQTPSPLLPEWGRKIFKGGNIPTESDDEIVQWAQKRNILPPAESWLADYKPLIDEAFRELI